MKNKQKHGYVTSQIAMNYIFQIQKNDKNIENIVEYTYTYNSAKTEIEK